MCSIVAWPPHKQQEGSSVMPQVCTFAGEWSVSYTAQRRKDILAGYIFHISDQVTWLSGMSKPFVFLAKKPCFSYCLTSPRTMSLLSLPWALLHSLKWVEPIPWKPMPVFLMTSFSWGSTSDTGELADHFLPERLTTPAAFTFVSTGSERHNKPALSDVHDNWW